MGDQGRDDGQEDQVDLASFGKVIIDETLAIHPQPPGYVPEIATVARIDHAFLSGRYPRLSGVHDWILCGGFIVRIAPIDDDDTLVTLAFRLPKWPYLGLLVVRTDQDDADLRALQASTSTDGLTAAGQFTKASGSALVGGVDHFNEGALATTTGAPVLLLPDWDQPSFDMLAAFGVRVRT